MSLLDLASRRHSPRAFDGSSLTWDDLAEAFEVARLSSSSYNNQPWRFVVALRGEEGFDALLETAVEANRTWMKDASAIVGVIASTVLEKTGETDHAQNQTAKRPQRHRLPRWGGDAMKPLNGRQAAWRGELWVPRRRFALKGCTGRKEGQRRPVGFGDPASSSCPPTCHPERSR